MARHVTKIAVRRHKISNALKKHIYTNFLQAARRRFTAYLALILSLLRSPRTTGTGTLPALFRPSLFRWLRMTTGTSREFDLESDLAVVTSTAILALVDFLHGDRVFALLHCKGRRMADIATVAYAVDPVRKDRRWKGFRPLNAFLPLKNEIALRRQGRCNPGDR